MGKASTKQWPSGLEVGGQRGGVGGGGGVLGVGGGGGWGLDEIFSLERHERRP